MTPEEIKYHRGMAYLSLEYLITKSESKIPSDTRQRARNKLRILIRDNLSCVDCGSTEHLTIDHEEPKPNTKQRSAVSYSQNNKLQTLCVDCHLKKNKNEKQRKRAIRLRWGK